MNIFKIINNRLNYAKEWFALLGVLKQLGVITVLGFLIVVVSGVVVGSVENSYVIFVDPSSLPLMKDSSVVLLFSFLLTIAGLVVTGFIISILSSSLENTFRDIRQGHLNYIGENHTLIINYNHKIMKVLQEINLLYQDNKSLHDVIILIDNDSDIKKLQIGISKQHFKSLHILVRFGDTFSFKRYLELSIMTVHAIIILSNDSIEDNFLKDNNNLRLTNLLFSDEDFANCLREKRKIYKPVKAVVEFTDTHHFDSIVNNLTQSLFLALAPKKVLSSILSMSMIDLNFYTTWSQLLSFEDYELYFVDAKKFNLHGTKYKDALLRKKEGLLIGISRFVDGKNQFLLNAHDETIQELDWLIFISQDIHKISFLDKPLEHEPKLFIEHPKETFVRNIAIIGDKRDIDANELLDMDRSKISYVDYTQEELYEKVSFDRLINPNANSETTYDTIIINLDDELIYRVALNLKVLFSDKEIRKFVFLVDDALIAEHLETAGFKNTILSHLLISKYIAQVSNQLSLHKVFNILFVKEGPEINFIETTNLPSDVEELKIELINNGMQYLGVIKLDDSIEFESSDISEAKKIVVLSDGEM